MGQLIGPVQDSKPASAIRRLRHEQHRAPGSLALRGVYGTSGNTGGSGVYGYSTGTGPGVRAYTTSAAGHFAARQGHGLKAAQVTGNLTTDRVAYRRPGRTTHRAGQRAFSRGSSATTYNTLRQRHTAGACVSAGQPELLAPVHLPHGASSPSFGYTSG